MFEALESREFMSATTTLSAAQPVESTPTTAQATIAYPKSPTTVQPPATPHVIISIIGILVG
jgi:hypothetical protein